MRESTRSWHSQPVACRLSPVACRLSPIACRLSPVACPVLSLIQLSVWFFKIYRSAYEPTFWGEHYQIESKLISRREVEYKLEKLTWNARRVIIIIPKRYHTQLADERTEFPSYIAILIIKLLFYKLVQTC